MAGLEDEEADIGADVEVGADELESCQVDDGEGNLITFTAQYLAEEGIDIANITDADVEKLIKMAKKATVDQTDKNTAAGDNTPSHAYSRSLRPRNSLKRPSMDYDSPPPSRSPAAKGEVKRIKLEHHHLPSPSPTSVKRRGRPKKSEVKLSDIDQSTLRNLVDNGIVKFVDEHGKSIPSSTVVELDNMPTSGARKVVSIEKVDNTSKTTSEKSKTPIVSTTKKTSPSKSPSFALMANAVELKRGNHTVPAKIQQVRHGISYKVQYEDGHVEWVGGNEAELPEGALTLKVLTKDAASDEDDDEDEPDYMPPNGFARVTSQFDLSHRKRKWVVTNEEVQRRLNGPEYLRVSAVEQLVRGSKKGGEMRGRLDAAGIVVPPYNKMRAKHTSFTRWTEGESKELLTSLQNDCLPYFPVKDVQGLLANYFSSWSEEDKKVTLQKAKEILSIIQNTINEEENHSNPLWQDYSILTHEFAPLIWRHYLEVLINIFDTV